MHACTVFLTLRVIKLVSTHWISLEKRTIVGPLSDALFEVLLICAEAELSEGYEWSGWSNIVATLNLRAISYEKTSCGFNIAYYGFTEIREASQYQLD